jgi:hypothetical protein
MAGDAASRSVRVGNEAAFFEGGHFVAHGGTGKAKGMTFDKRLRPDGLRRIDEVIDDKGEDALTAL